MRERHEIYQDLQAERPYVVRHENTPRVWEAFNRLLDELVELQHVEAMELMETEANGEIS